MCVRVRVRVCACVCVCVKGAKYVLAIAFQSTTLSERAFRWRLPVNVEPDAQRHTHQHRMNDFF